MSFVILLLLVPVLIILSILVRLKRKKSKESVNKWSVIYETENLLLESSVIAKDELPEELDYPGNFNWDSQDIYLTEIKSSPEVNGFSNQVFDGQFAKVDSGVFFLSWNKVGEGMTIWFLDKIELSLTKVKNLESNWWEIVKQTESGVTFATAFKDRDVSVQIKLENNK